MIYGKQNTLEKMNLIQQVMTCCRFLRVIFYGYGVIALLFWFLNCFEIDWLYLFNWLFSIPYQIISLFYRAEGLSADFSLAIISGISLIIGFCIDLGLNSLFQKLVEMEEEEEKKQRNKKVRVKKTISRPKPFLETEETQVNFIDSSLLFLINPHVNKIKKSKSDADLSFQDIELWRQRVNKKIIENINFSKPMQKGYYRKNLFVVYQDFNYIDDFVYYISPTLDALSLEFRKYGILTTYTYVLSALPQLQNLEKELDCMDTILSLNFNNEFIVTERFKKAYDRKLKQIYTTHVKGEYNLSKNLSITNRQLLYTLTDKERKGKQV